MIQLELSDAQVEVGQGQTPDGQPIKVIRVIAPVAFLLPLPEDSAKAIATALSAAGIQIAHAGDVPKLQSIDGSLLDNH